MQAIAGYTDRTTTIDGIAFHWLEWGAPSSPPMVLLHGLTGHAHTWDHMAPQLAERYHVLALDQRGHGDSGHTATYTTDDFVGDIEAIRKVWGLDRFILVGLSMGGHNAMAYAAAYPQHVSHAVIIDIPPRLVPDAWEGRDEQVRLAETGHGAYTDFEDVVRDARAGNPTAPEENLRYRTHWNLNHAPDGSMRLKYDARVQAAWQPADLTSQLSHITCPVLLVRGGKTTVLTQARAAAMVAAMPDADFAEIAESGHSVPTDTPELLTPVVLDWLASRGA
jgi:pimeloyl-ACP methyl ester carboxylesterase